MKVLVAGVEREYRLGTVAIDHNVAARSTARFTLRHEYDVLVALHSSIEIQDDQGNALFRGFALPRRRRPDNSTLRHTDIQAIDDHYRVDKRHLTESYTDTKPGDIVKDIVDNLLVAEGITQGTIQDGTGTLSVTYTDDNVSSVIQSLADASGYTWWVDLNLQLHFLLPGTLAAPRELYLGEILYGSAEIEPNAENYRNRVRVRGTDVVVEDAAEIAARAALEGTSGIVEDAIDPENETAAARTTRAQGVLDQYKVVGDTLTFRTLESGYAKGQTLVVHLPDDGLDGTSMLIRHVAIEEYTQHPDKGVKYSITARSGPNSSGPLNRIQESLDRGSAAENTNASSSLIEAYSLPSLFGGLVMRADPHSPTNRIYIERLNYVALVGNLSFDGSPWAGQSYPLTLDTGSLAASTWYEVWLSALPVRSCKPVTPFDDPNAVTRSLVLTKAQTYVSDTFVNANANTANIGDATNTTAQGQSFQLVTAGVVDYIDLWINRVANPTDYAYIEIRIDNGGSPDMTSGGLLATSQYICTPTPTFANAKSPMRVTFPSRPSLQSATTYWLVFRRTGANNATNYWSTRYSTTAGYASGQRKTWNGSAWASPGDGSDMYMSIFRTIDASLTPAAGYSSLNYIKVGYIRTDASTNLQPFLAIDRRIRQLVAATQISLGTAGTGLQLTGNGTDMPPCKGWFTVRVNGSSIVSGVPDGYRMDYTNSKSALESGGSYVFSTQNSNPPNVVIDRFFTNFQCLYASWDSSLISPLRIEITETEWLT